MAFGFSGSARSDLAFTAVGWFLGLWLATLISTSLGGLLWTIRLCFSTALNVSGHDGLLAIHDTLDWSNRRS
jgi:hypothetical protein